MATKVYQRGNQWWIEFYYRKRRFREAIGPDKKLAEDVLAKRMVAIRENRFFPEKVKEIDPIKFHDFLVEYRTWSKANKKPLTCTRELYVMRTLDKEFEGKCLNEITAWQVEKYKSERRKTCEKASVNREIGLLKHMMSMAVKWQKLRENPVAEVKRFKGETKRVRYLKPAEILVLQSNCDGLMKGILRPIVTIAVHTGMRKGEILTLTWSQIDFEQGIITLLDTKNGERRDIHMNETVKATLNAIERKGELVFPSRTNTRIQDCQIHIAFQEAVRKSGIEDFRFHDLRHTFASNLVMSGAELNDVRELLGHKDMKMTLRYAHLSPKHKGKVVNILDQVFDSAQFSPQVEKVVQLRG